MLIDKCSEKYGTDVCVRLYSDGSGVVASDHIKECPWGKELFRFNDFGELKRKLRDYIPELKIKAEIEKIISAEMKKQNLTKPTIEGLFKFEAEFPRDGLEGGLGGGTLDILQGSTVLASLKIEPREGWMNLEEKYLPFTNPPKKYFHSFEHENRLITLCVYGGKIGYSVKLPDDPLDKELGKKISLGRALKCPIGEFTLDRELGRDKGVLKSIAIHWERKIKKDVKKYIKGIR